MPNHQEPARHHRSSESVVRRASIACMSCRTRRIRCDGVSKRNQPCTHCRDAGTTCEFPHDDGRKRSRVDLVRLQERVATLERSGWQGLTLEEASKDTLSARTIRSPAIDKGYQPVPVPKTSRAVNHVRLKPPFMNKDTSLLQPSAPRPRRNFGHRFLNLRPPAAAYLCVDEHGQLRYFGYTSAMQMVPTLQPTLPDESSVATSPASDTAETLADSAEFQAHLVDLYFTYQNPALPIVQKDIFMQEWSKGKRTRHFSKFLLYSILARSVRLSDWPDALSVMPVYRLRARSEILDELEDPLVATIQALCIYGNFLASVGDERGCWLYPGIAYRLAYDLGLQSDCHHLVQKGTLTERDRQVRISTMWGCFIMDKLYSLCLGRPCVIPMEQISVPRPSLESTGPGYELLSAFVGLSAGLAKISAILNGKQDVLEQDECLNRLSDTADELLQWLKSLPKDLKWHSQGVRDPEICALHMQLLTSIILVHRPFAGYDVSTTGISVPPKSFKPLAGYTCAMSRQICTQNSIRVAKMLDAYQQQHDIRTIFSMGTYISLTAAMSLVSELSGTSPTSDPKEVKEALNICVKALRDLGPWFPLAHKHHSIVLSFLKFCGHSDDALLDQSEVISPNVQPARGETPASSEPGADRMVEPAPSPLLNNTGFDFPSWRPTSSADLNWTMDMYENPARFAAPPDAGGGLHNTLGEQSWMWDPSYMSTAFGGFQPEMQSGISTHDSATATARANLSILGRRSQQDQDVADIECEPSPIAGLDFSTFPLPPFTGVPWALDGDMT